MFANVGSACADTCTEHQMLLSDGITCVDAKFSVKTTNLSANTDFEFDMSALGTFYVDWGDGSVETISRANTAATKYSHTYTTSGEKTIRFGGVATGYNTSITVAAISFSAYNPTLIQNLSGSMGAVFPTLGNSNGQQPRFYETFKYCSNLTTIPENLFSGITGSTNGMFRSTFDRCTSLRTIPDDLFVNITGTAPNLFRSTFYECTSLTKIPDNLFSGVTGASDSMFKYTFCNTSGLTGFIPHELFAGLNGETATDLMQNIFLGSSLLTSCPNGTEQYITGYESSWSGKVACLEDADCEGATYYDSSVYQCVACPHGYTYNTTTGKIHETECQIQCPAGTWTGEFTQLDYIENTGTQYIDTGYLISASTISGKLTVSAPNGASTFSQQNIGNFAGNVDSSAGHNTNFKGGNFGLWIVNGNSGSKITTASPYFEANTLYDINYNVSGSNRTLTVNDTTKSGTFTGNIISTNTFKVFSNGCPGGCGDKIFVGRIHSLKLYEQSNLVLDLIPARRDVDDALGMYDKISGQFFTNAGSGTFLAGPDITTFGGETCVNVGDGYYSASTITNFGSVSQRYKCPNDAPTNVENATSIAQCVGTTTYTCNSGYYLPMNSQQCTLCQINSYCTGGTYTFNTSADQGISACPAGLFAPIGMWEPEQCGRILHIGDAVLYLRSTKKTTPSLNIDTTHDGNPNFFGNMTTIDTPITNGSTRRLKVNYQSQIYYIYDDSAGINP